MLNNDSIVAKYLRKAYVSRPRATDASKVTSQLLAVRQTACYKLPISLGICAAFAHSVGLVLVLQGALVRYLNAIDRGSRGYIECAQIGASEGAICRGFGKLYHLDEFSG